MIQKCGWDTVGPRILIERSKNWLHCSNRTEMWFVKQNLVTLCFLKSLSFTADRGGAVSTFLGKQVAETVEAVSKVIPGGEPLVGQLLLAPDANEALLMPGLVTVVHSSGGDGLKDMVSCILSNYMFRCWLALLDSSADGVCALKK